MGIMCLAYSKVAVKINAPKKEHNIAHCSHLGLYVIFSPMENNVGLQSLNWKPNMGHYLIPSQL